MSESSEHGRSVPDGSPTQAAVFTAYGTDSGEAADSAPEVPLPPPPAASILEVAPVQTQTLTQTGAHTDAVAEPEAEPGVLVATTPHDHGPAEAEADLLGASGPADHTEPDPTGPDLTEPGPT
ncbi:RNA polymerase sigma factor, partial [Streptomyces sp. NPDC093586]